MEAVENKLTKIKYNKPDYDKISKSSKENNSSFNFERLTNNYIDHRDNREDREESLKEKSFKKPLSIFSRI